MKTSHFTITNLLKTGLLSLHNIIFKMTKFIVHFALTLLVVNALLSSCEGLRSGIRGSSKSSKNPTKPKTYLGSNTINATGQSTSRRGVGLSAWGIITLVVSLIMAGAGIYYFSICYPILCKKTRKYDIIGLPSAV